MAFFRLRRVLEEFEARLQPPVGKHSGAVGKSERKRYGDSDERLKVRARRLDLRDGTTVEVVISGTVVAEITAESGRVSVDFTSKDRHVPEVSEGDVLELRARGKVLLSGIYKPD